jgi:hypothetical protein
MVSRGSTATERVSAGEPESIDRRTRSRLRSSANRALTTMTTAHPGGRPAPLQLSPAIATMRMSSSCLGGIRHLPKLTSV